jgi:hypothetical protein
MSRCLIIQGILIAAVLAPLRPLPAQDLEGSVRKLTEELKSDDLDISHRALKALIDLGPGALHTIKKEMTTAEGDTRLRLLEALEKIERAETVRNLVGDPVLATLEAKNKPTRQVLEELAKQTGQPLVISHYLGTPISVSIQKKPFWEALRAISRANGGLSWRFLEDTELTMEECQTFAPPQVIHGNLTVYFTGFTRGFSREGDKYFTIYADLAATKEHRPSFATFQIDELEDDRGTKLTSPIREYVMGRPVEKGEKPGLLIEDSFTGEQFAPSTKATRIAHFRGSVQAIYILSRKMVLETSDPGNPKDQFLRSGDLTFLVKEITDQSSTKTARIEIRGKDDILERVGLLTFRFRNEEGREYFVKASRKALYPGPEGMTVWLEVPWECPGSKTRFSLQIFAPSDLEKINIPFEFRDIPILDP